MLDSVFPSLILLFYICICICVYILYIYIYIYIRLMWIPEDPVHHDECVLVSTWWRCCLRCVCVCLSEPQ